jgi:hypothetical protein
MTRNFEDKRRCPHCGGELHRVRYLMERSAEVNVLSSRAIAWVLVAVLVVIVISLGIAR